MIPKTRASYVAYLTNAMISDSFTCSRSSTRLTIAFRFYSDLTRMDWGPFCSYDTEDSVIGGYSAFGGRL